MPWTLLSLFPRDENHELSHDESKNLHLHRTPRIVRNFPLQLHGWVSDRLCSGSSRIFLQVSPQRCPFLLFVTVSKMFELLINELSWLCRLRFHHLHCLSSPFAVFSAVQKVSPSVGTAAGKTVTSWAARQLYWLKMLDRATPGGTSVSITWPSDLDQNPKGWRQRLSWRSNHKPVPLVSSWRRLRSTSTARAWGGSASDRSLPISKRLVYGLNSQ